ncbi:MAG TPA: ATP-dependent DNA helicase RecG [Spirochaetota bacterium]|nr:ATP-dependent DNA helicase RecG [Spirochaetota bacterium]HRX45949.1 ATP-dependent DNA helicase RecG [Spirochaetota bacterium]
MLDIPVTALKGIGSVKAGILKSEAGIETIEDLLYYTPRRYLDRSNVKRIVDVFHEEEVTVSGTVISSKTVRAGKTFLQVDISDGTDILSGIFFGGLFFFEKIFLPGENVIFSGKININRRKQIVHPEFDFFDGDSNSMPINTGRIIPLYRSSINLKKNGFDSRGFRRVISHALKIYSSHLTEFLDSSLLQKYSLPDINRAISGIHFPESADHAEQSRKRLAFNEVFSLQYFLLLNKKVIKYRETKKAAKPELNFVINFINTLPFKLTDDQMRAIEEIKSDIISESPMNRLLQGDVGAGKTIVALGTALIHISMNRQVALMAPTEILAKQHYDNAVRFLPDEIKCALLTGSTAAKDKTKIYNDLSDGSISLVIGTHALLQPSVVFKNLGYIIIDEQHRFGVEQRGVMRTKGVSTDLLIMTATPIPRSLSMTFYGDMDVSYIKHKPSGRLLIKTLAFTEEKLPGVYRSIKNYLEQGRQVYYVLPLIDESDKTDLKSATEAFNHLKKEIFPDKKIELIHSKIPEKDKQNIMTRFKDGVVDILVSTTVIEVGIDVPNASIMVIEHAERFGLAQLHQLRGRVGRGSHQSFCILIHKPDLSDDASERIKTMTETDDGFLISEKDLMLRGSGQLVGTRQHGANDFEFTDITKDYDIILSARKEAESIIDRISPEKIKTGVEIIESENRAFAGLRTKRILQILS